MFSEPKSLTQKHKKSIKGVPKNMELAVTNPVLSISSLCCDTGIAGSFGGSNIYEHEGYTKEKPGSAGPKKAPVSYCYKRN